MKKISLGLFFMILWLAGIGQSQVVEKPRSFRENPEYWDKWVADLTEIGVDQRNDSFFVSAEVVRLLNEPAYRFSVYPERYTWEQTVQLLLELELKKAFWFLINLYETDQANRPLILNTVIAYDSLIDMGKVLLSSYYTYGFADPRVCKVVNGKPDIFRPDLLESGLVRTKEIIQHIWAYRKMKEESK